jgi:hypothetical protein
LNSPAAPSATLQEIWESISQDSFDAAEAARQGNDEHGDQLDCQIVKVRRTVGRPANPSFARVP